MARTGTDVDPGAVAGPARPDGAAGAQALARLVAPGGVVVLGGAGVSTTSGIPDYRGPTGRLRTAPPMQWQEFASSPAARQRYWARGQVGYRRYAHVRPNAAHRALAALEHAGLVDLVVTQNVDGLHQAAGSRAVVELHGSLAEVVCMACGVRERRTQVQARQAAANPWIEDVAARTQADGDAVLDEGLAARFVPAACRACSGDLRPDVVFFGEFVPRQRVVAARTAVERASALLVVGSSLQVGSGYLLVRRAVRHGVPVAIVNQGPTRADRHADLRLHGDVAAVLPALATALDVGMGTDDT